MCVVHVVLACFRKSRASFFSAPALAGTEKVKAIGGSRALGHDLSIVPKPTIGSVIINYFILAQYLKVWRSSFDDPRISGSSKSFHMCTSESDGSSGSLANFRTRTRSLVYPHPPLKRKCMWGQCLEDLSANLQPESGECELAQWLMFISGTSNQSLEDVSLHCGLCSSPALSTRVWRT